MCPEICSGLENVIMYSSPSNMYLIYYFSWKHGHIPSLCFVLYHLSLAAAVITSCVRCCAHFNIVSYLSMCSVKLLAGGIVAMSKMNSMMI